MLALNLLLLAAGALLAIVAIVLAAIAWRGEGHLEAVRRTETYPVADLLRAHSRGGAGPIRLGDAVEVVGSIECDTPLRAPYSETSCIAYEYSVSEESEKTIGGRGFQPRREIESETFDNHDRRAARFWVRDATGRIAVETAGAAMELRETVARYEAYTGLQKSEREIWRQEWALPIGGPVFVHGFLTDDNGAPLIARDPLARGPLLISYRDERSLHARLGRRAYGLYLAGGLLGGLAALLVAAALLV